MSGLTKILEKGGERCWRGREEEKRETITPASNRQSFSSKGEKKGEEIKQHNV